MVLSQIFSQHVFINNFNFQTNFFGVALHASDGPDRVLNAGQG